MAEQEAGSLMTLWYLTRAAGLVALIAFTAATAMGAVASRRTPGAGPDALDRRYLVQMIHRSAAVTGLLAILVHVATLVLDSFVNVSISGALIPFTAGYRPLALAMGTIGVYAIIAAAVSGAARGRLATSVRAAKAWRSIHLLAYLGWALSMGHGVLAGTDTGTWWSTSLYIACGAVVLAAVTARLASRGRAATSPLNVARTLDRSRS